MQKPVVQLYTNARENSAVNEKITSTSARWSLGDVKALYNLPFNDLLFKAQSVHRENFNPNEVQISTLLSIKTGGCPEDCAYCPQAKRYQTGLKEDKKMMDKEQIIASAIKAKSIGATRFCIGGAYRNLRESDTENLMSIIKDLKNLGLEVCATFGMVTKPQAVKLKSAGLDYYNHNIDTSQEYYEEIIKTRKFEDRLETLDHVREAGLNVCSGGIIGMGETIDDRLKMLMILANMPHPPESVPINKLVPIPGTPLGMSQSLDMLEFVRIIAIARIMMPRSYVRLSAGRDSMSDEAQAMCFFAGANSIFYGECLLTAANALPERDDALFAKLGLGKLKYKDID